MITHGLSGVLGDFKTLVIPTNEELAIAKKIKTLLHYSPSPKVADAL